MSPRLARALWLLPALIVLVLICGTILHAWRAPYLGAVWDARGQVLGIEDNTPADMAGLREGDTILTLNGRTPPRWDRHIGRTLRAGNEIPATVLRADQTLTLAFTSDLFPADYWFILPMFQAVALAFWLTSLIVLLSTSETSPARMFYLMGQIWAADLAVGLFMTTGLPGAWEIWGILSGLLTPVMVHFHSIFPEQRWLVRRRWALILCYGTGLLVALHWIPTPLAYPPWGFLWTLTSLWVGLGFIAAIVLVATAYISTRSAYARRRVRLIVIGTALGFTPFALLTAIWGQVSMRFTFPFMLIIPITYGIALWRHNLMGFDRVIRRGVVYILVSGLLFGAYFAALALLNTVLPTDTVWRAILGAASALIAAATLRPLQDWVQRWVDRLFYGGWYDYRTLVEDVGQTLSHTLDQETLAHVLVQQVPQAMHLPGAWLLLERNGEMATIAKHGDATTVSPSHTDRVEMSSSHAQVPLVVEGQTVGLWLLTGRPVEDWGPEDKSILTALGQQAGLAAQNVRLIAELRAKMAEVEGMHQGLLAAREEERADLARELHDSTIQDMIGLRYRLEALQDGESEPVEALHTRIGQMIGELRRMCSDLRPPMLDQLGLAAALQALAREVTDRGLPVETHLDDLSLADDAAIGLYRICQEALSNALRHAEASRATVTLSRVDEKTTLTVTDDGCGFTPSEVKDKTGSFGLLGMTERAEGFGGHLEIKSAPGEGTQISVHV
jgi:signal transduction histidine kinase